MYRASTMPKDRPITIRDLYPDLTEADLAVAEANLRRYVAVIVRIYERLEREGRSWPDCDPLSDLTTSDESHILNERSNSPQK